MTNQDWRLNQAEIYDHLAAEESVPRRALEWRQMADDWRKDFELSPSANAKPCRNEGDVSLKRWA